MSLVQFYVHLLNQPPILASIQRALLIGSANIQHGALGIHPFQFTWHFLNLKMWLPSSIYIWTIEVIYSDLFYFAPRIASSLTMCNFLHLFPIILLRLILYIPLIHSLPHSPTFYLHFTKCNLCQARWGRTIDRSIKNTANLHWPSNVCLSSPLPLCIVVQMTNVPNVVNEAGW